VPHQAQADAVFAVSILPSCLHRLRAPFDFAQGRPSVVQRPLLSCQPQRSRRTRREPTRDTSDEIRDTDSSSADFTDLTDDSVWHETSRFHPASRRYLSTHPRFYASTHPRFHAPPPEITGFMSLPLWADQHGGSAGALTRGSVEGETSTHAYTHLRIYASTQVMPPGLNAINSPLAEGGGTTPAIGPLWGARTSGNAAIDSRQP
jgi:hypothetical protein